MPFFPRDEKDIISESLQQMQRNTKITQLAPGGKARFFLTTVSKEQARQQALFDTNLLQPYIKYSNSKFLDFFGDMLNLPRIESRHAEATNNNFMFYIQSGQFGDLNNGSSFIIPAGQTISTMSFEGDVVTPGLETQPVIEYKTISAITCEPNSSYAYGSVRAVIEGEFSSLPRNTLVQHEYNAYALSNSNLLKCTNKFAIDNGVNRERDESYRYRLSNIFAARNQALFVSIRLAALSIPGVSDVIIINSEQGPGTFALYIKSITPTVSPELISSVSNAVNAVTLYGIRPFVSAPATLGLELYAAVNWSTKATKEEISLGYTSMRNIVESTINELDIGEKIDFEDLAISMLDAAPKASRIGLNKSNTFEEAYIHRASPTGEGSIRNLLFSDVLTPLYNERVLLETSTRYRGIHFITF